MTVFCPLSTQPVFLRGVIQIGAQIEVFDAGTLTPRTAYGDGLAGSPLAQPILTDGNGCIPSFWLVGNPYKVRIIAPNGVQIREVDNLPGDVASGGGGGGGSTGNLVTGDMQWNYGTSVITGRVRANGKSIGNLLSGASELASATALNLFTWLWNADPNLAVSGGRGVSALADWNANHTIALPDFNGRAPRCIDGMGSSVTGRLTGGTFASGNATTLGSAGGTATETLLLAQIPAHQHTFTTQNSAAHSHTFTTATAGSHNHTGTSGTESVGHTHSGVTALESQPHTHAASTDFQGAHIHNGSVTDTQGDHAHTITAPTNTGAIAGNGTLTIYWAGTGTAATSTNGAHSHNLVIASDGTHNHNVSVGTESANHNHGFNTGGESATHTHSISADGTHSHTGVTDAGGVHSHTGTTDATGGGAAHNNLDPFVLATLYLVL